MLHNLTITGKLSEKSVVVVGDIHGHITPLDDLILLLMDTGAQVVFVGDYIDRGEHGIEVLQRIRSLAENPAEWGLSQVTALMGNHERMVLDAVEAETRPGLWSYAMNLWLDNGGRMEEFSAIRSDFAPWLSSLPLFYEHSARVAWRGGTKKLMVCHASLKYGVPMTEQDPMTLVWDRKRIGYGHDYVTITGHTVCEFEQPEVYTTSTGPLLRIDTGAAYGGPLSGVALEEVDG